MNGMLKSTFQTVLRGFGYQLAKYPSIIVEATSAPHVDELPGPYERVKPGASYALENGRHVSSHF